MSEQQRCATCRHWECDPPKWGVCRWAITATYPFWMVIYSNKPVQTTDTEGTNCETWEAMP